MPGVDIKKDDNVQVIAGKDRGKQRPGHPRPAARGPRHGRRRRRGRRRPRATAGKRSTSGQQLQQGGIIDTELFIDISNVQLVCPNCGEPTRVGHRIDGDDKFRVCRKCEAELQGRRRSSTGRTTPTATAEAALPRRARAAAPEGARATATSCRWPGLEKIVVNMGVGDAIKDGRMLDAAVADLDVITGQKPVITKARKSIAGFKLREGMPIGAKVTLRGDYMWEFLDRLLVAGAAADPRLPRPEPGRVRRARELHHGRDRAADLPGDRLRQGGRRSGAWTSRS